MFNRITDWIKANPWKAAFITVATALAIFMAAAGDKVVFSEAEAAYVDAQGILVINAPLVYTGVLTVNACPTPDAVREVVGQKTQADLDAKFEEYGCLSGPPIEVFVHRIFKGKISGALGAGYVVEFTFTPDPTDSNAVLYWAVDEEAAEKIFDFFNKGT